MLNLTGVEEKFIREVMYEDSNSNISWVLAICKLMGRSPLTYSNLFKEYDEAVVNFIDKNMIFEEEENE